MCLCVCTRALLSLLLTTAPSCRDPLQEAHSPGTGRQAAKGDTYGPGRLPEDAPGPRVPALESRQASGGQNKGGVGGVIQAERQGTPSLGGGVQSQGL